MLQENIRANLCKLLDAHPSVINIKVCGSLLLYLNQPYCSEGGALLCVIALSCMQYQSRPDSFADVFVLHDIVPAPRSALIC